MKRTNDSYRVPDVINHSVSSNFTQIPNELLKNPKITAKSKTILFLLLSNKKGWHSYISVMKKMLKEGESAIRSGIEELEEYGYLVRIRYRDKDTKQWRGSFWSYTDTPWKFTGILQTVKELKKHGLEAILPENLHVENQDMGSQDVGIQRLIICNNKNTKNNKINSSSEDGNSKGLLGDISSEYDLIKPSHFKKFWKLYPTRGSKGKAKKKWETLCRKDNRPTWKEIKEAIQAQKETKQWQTKKYIPHASTWINQERWLDDPEQLNHDFSKSKQKNTTVTHPRKDGYEYPTNEVDLEPEKN